MPNTRYPEAQDADPASSRRLQLRAFNNYPDLAAWCRPRVPASAERHFAMGHGKVFVALLDFMGVNARSEISLLAISEVAADGSSEHLKAVYACLKPSAAVLRELPASAVLLY